MRITEQLEPARVFYYFEEIASIPHGSRNTKQISDYCVDFAKAHNLEYYQDDYNNVIIIREASNGYEAKDPIIIQGHLDMVCEKEPGCTKDMNTEGLDLYIDGEVLRAKGTTLGGDDGIAVAIALAILEDDSFNAPRIEAVFTTDEEIGMIGASHIDVSMLKGHTMLNIDSEEEGVLTVSCAGGVEAHCSIPVEKEMADDCSCIRLQVSGLTGGHSGIEIIKKRANANVVMGRLLNHLYNSLDFYIVNINGGLKDNAIPNSCVAHIQVDDSPVVINRLGQLVSEFRDTLKAEFADTDPDMHIDYDYAPDEDFDIPFNAESTVNVLKTLSKLPDGIVKMSEDIPGLVQTSLNNGILSTEDDNLNLVFCIRSSVDNEKWELKDRVESIIEEAGGKMDASSDYPGWAYLKESRLRDVMVEQFTKQYGKAPVIEAIHAGVECGIFAAKIPGLDAVSFGPNLKEIHTFRENMNIASVARTYELTKNVINNL